MSLIGIPYYKLYLEQTNKIYDADIQVTKALLGTERDGARPHGARRQHRPVEIIHQPVVSQDPHYFTVLDFSG